MQTINEPQSIKNPQNEAFRLYYVRLPLAEAQEFRTQIVEKCGWSRFIWFNKLHNITAITKAELQVITEIAPAFKQGLSFILPSSELDNKL